MSVRNEWWKLKDVTRLPELKKQTRKDHEVQDFCGPQGARSDDDPDQIEKRPLWITGTRNTLVLYKMG